MVKSYESHTVGILVGLWYKVDQSYARGLGEIFTG